MGKDKTRQLLVVLALLATLAVNMLANLLPLNGQNTGEISDRFDILFVPAGYVFSIWGLIYLLLFVYAVYQALPAQADSVPLRKTGYLFIFSCIFNIAWLFLWHYNYFEFTVVAMLLLLISLILIYVRLGIGKGKPEKKMFWLVQLPFSIYLGWITVATVANITQWLYYINWSGWGIAPLTWFLIILGVAVVLAAINWLTRHDAAYQAVLAWAFAGIAVRWMNDPVVYIASLAAAAAAGLLFVAAVMYRLRKT